MRIILISALFLAVLPFALSACSDLTCLNTEDCSITCITRIDIGWTYNGGTAAANNCSITSPSNPNVCTSRTIDATKGCSNVDVTVTAYFNNKSASTLRIAPANYFEQFINSTDTFRLLNSGSNVTITGALKDPGKEIYYLSPGQPATYSTTTSYSCANLNNYVRSGITYYASTTIPSSEGGSLGTTNNNNRSPNFLTTLNNPAFVIIPGGITQSSATMTVQNNTIQTTAGLSAGISCNYPCRSALGTHSTNNNPMQTTTLSPGNNPSITMPISQTDLLWGSITCGYYGYVYRVWPDQPNNLILYQLQGTSNTPATYEMCGEVTGFDGVFHESSTVNIGIAINNVSAPTYRIILKDNSGTEHVWKDSTAFNPALARTWPNATLSRGIEFPVASPEISQIIAANNGNIYPIIELHNNVALWDRFSFAMSTWGIIGLNNSTTASPDYLKFSGNGLVTHDVAENAEFVLRNVKNATTLPITFSCVNEAGLGDCSNVTLSSTNCSCTSGASNSCTCSNVPFGLSDDGPKVNASFATNGEFKLKAVLGTGTGAITEFVKVKTNYDSTCEVHIYSSGMTEPSELTVGQSYDLQLIATNTGKASWTPIAKSLPASGKVVMGVSDEAPFRDPNPYFNYINRLEFESGTPDPLLKDQKAWTVRNAARTIKITPQREGSVVIKFKTLREDPNGFWFGQECNKPVTIVAAAPPRAYDSECSIKVKDSGGNEVSQNLTAGENYTLELSVSNNGIQTWNPVWDGTSEISGNFLIAAKIGEQFVDKFIWIDSWTQGLDASLQNRRYPLIPSSAFPGGTGEWRTTTIMIRPNSVTNPTNSTLMFRTRQEPSSTKVGRWFGNICTKNITINPPVRAKNVEIQSVNLTPAQPVKGTNLNVTVKVKNSGSSIISGSVVKLKVEGPGGITTPSATRSATLQIGETTFQFTQFISSWASYQESQVYTITAELYDSSNKLLDRKQTTFILGRSAAAAVPEANPLLAVLVLGIVLGILAWKKK